MNPADENKDENLRLISYLTPDRKYVDFPRTFPSQTSLVFTTSFQVLIGFWEFRHVTVSRKRRQTRLIYDQGWIQGVATVAFATVRFS